MNRPRSSFRSEVATTAAFSIARVGFLVLLVPLLSAHAGVVVMGLVLLARRNAATLATVAQLGISQSMRKYGTFGDDGFDPYVHVGGLIFAWGTVALFLALSPLWYVAGNFFYPSSPMAGRLSVATALYASALVLSFAIASSFTARRQFAAGNAIDVAVGAASIFPVLLIGDVRSAGAIVEYQTAIAYAICAIGTIFVLRRARVRLSLGALSATIRKLLRFGMPRTVISGMDMLLLTAGPFALRDRPAEAGVLLVGLTATRILQVAVQPVAQVTGVRTAQLAQADDQHRIAQMLRAIVAALLHALLLAIPFLAIWYDVLLRFWLNQELASAVGRLMLPLAIFSCTYTVFQAVKGIIDMQWDHPYNVYSLTMALGSVIAAGAVRNDLVGVSWGLALGGVILVVTSLFWLRKQFRGEPGFFGMVRLGGLSLALLGTCWMIRSLAGDGLFGLLLSMLPLAAAVAALMWRPNPFVASVLKVKRVEVSR